MGSSVEETRLRSDPSVDGRWQEKRLTMHMTHMTPEVSGVSQDVEQHQSLPETELVSLG